jgi:hypothetical protein
MLDMETDRTNISIPADVHSALKLFCDSQDLVLSKIVTRWINDRLVEETSKSPMEKALGKLK